MLYKPTPLLDSQSLIKVPSRRSIKPKYDSNITEKSQLPVFFMLSNCLKWEFPCVIAITVWLWSSLLFFYDFSVAVLHVLIKQSCLWNVFALARLVSRSCFSTAADHLIDQNCLLSVRRLCLPLYWSRNHFPPLLFAQIKAAMLRRVAAI